MAKFMHSVGAEHFLGECARLTRAVSDGHRGRFTRDFLTKQASHANHDIMYSGPYIPTLWGRSIKDRPPVIDYEAVMKSDEEVGKYGFAYVDGCPPTPEATQKLLERISFIRHTHYGGFWDFTSDLASKDTAYTSIALEAHTDNTYFSDPARLQMFHLLSHTEGDGGASLLVDGFNIAMKLKKKEPAAYRTLSTVHINSHASGNDGIVIVPRQTHTVLEHSPTSMLQQVRWNNSDRASIMVPLPATEKWYWAAR
ncbi:hypothetical protein SLS55_001037 [Diplodia seriata]|uniref:TauD/TfdA-like domain-containing protein n=1 Tax=Diplodia seriata TaxID=420778 RepID=A0ABR3CYZ5_9PEZI